MGTVSTTESGPSSGQQRPRDCEPPAQEPAPPPVAEQPDMLPGPQQEARGPSPACQGRQGPGRHALKSPTWAPPQGQVHTCCSGLENLRRTVSRSQVLNIRIEHQIPFNAISADGPPLPSAKDTRPAAQRGTVRTPRMAAQSCADGRADVQKTKTSPGPGQ